MARSNPKTATAKLRGALIRQAVKKLQEFGYESVDEKNIFTTMAYKMFFSSMLFNIPKSDRQASTVANKVIADLIRELS